jgi:hypothetical protein
MYVIVANGTRGACDGERARDWWGKPHQAFETKEEALSTVDKMNEAVMTYIPHMIPPFSVAELGDDGEPILPTPPPPPPPPPPQWEVLYQGHHHHYCHLHLTGSEWVRSANAAHAVRHPEYPAPYSLVEVAR